MKTRAQWLVDELAKAEVSNMPRSAYFEARAYQLYQMLEMQKDGANKEPEHHATATSIRGWHDR